MSRTKPVGAASIAGDAARLADRSASFEIDKPTKESLRDQAAVGGRWTAISALTTTLIQLLQLAILGRMLKPSDFGLMTMMAIVIGLAGIFSDLGISHYLVQVRSLTRALFFRLLALCVLVATLLAGAIALASQRIAVYYGAPVLADLLPTLGIVLVAMAVVLPFNAVFERAMKFRTIAIVETSAAFSGLFMAIALALAGGGVWALMGGQLTTASLKAALYVLLGSSVLKREGRAAWSDFGAAIRFGQFQMGARSLNFASWNIDKVIIGRTLGDAALGTYSVAFQLVIRPLFILNPIFTRVALPLFSGIQDDDERLTRGYLETLRTISLLVFPVYIALTTASDSVVYVLLGPQWHEAGSLVAILGASGFGFCLGNPIGSLLAARGRPDLGFYYNAIALLVYAVAIVVGSHYGIWAVAWAFVIASTIVLRSLEFCLRWSLLRMSPTRYLKAIRHLVFAALIPLIIFKGIVLVWVVPHAERIGLDVACAAAAVLAYFSYLWLAERRLLTQTLQLVVVGKR